MTNYCLKHISDDGYVHNGYQGPFALIWHRSNK